MSDTARINEVDQRVLGALPGGEKLKALLSERDLSVSAFAKKHDLWKQEVSMCLRGERPYPEIREAIAKELDLERGTVDELIDGEKAA